MSNKSILLISHGNFEMDFVEKVAGEIGRVYLSSVKLEISHVDLSEFYDPIRRQYNGDLLLKLIDSHTSSAYLKYLGLFQVDLFIPILTYIFGQAALGGRAGIASLYRLRNEHYGLKKDDQILLHRFIKVVIHEIGHMYGLIHCQNPSCVMRSSTYVEDIDQKNQELCINCRREIGLTQ